MIDMILCRSSVLQGMDVKLSRATETSCALLSLISAVTRVMATSMAAKFTIIHISCVLRHPHAPSKDVPDITPATTADVILLK